MNIDAKVNPIIFKNMEDFEPVHTFECGQSFRWIKQPDGSYTGVVKGNVFNVLKQDDSIIVECSSSDCRKMIEEYLDFDRDYSIIKDKLSEDDILKKAVDFGYGIRILKQDHWECLASFIISANNRIPLIMRSVENIAKDFGKPVQFNKKTYYSFPQPEGLTGIEEEKLELCGVGFRCKYIKHAARMVSSGEVDLAALENMDSTAAREELMRIPGVGPKIADCVLLYSYGKTDVFPTDVWIKRVVEVLYFGRNTKLREIQEFARTKFGDIAGFAQQYLFYYARENKITGK